MQCARLPLRQIQQSRFRILYRPCSRSIRGFQTSQPTRTSSGDPQGIPDIPTSDNVSKNGLGPLSATDTHDARSSNPLQSEGSTEDAKAGAKRNPGHYGSAVRRAMRNRKTLEKTSPAAIIPSWFQERNIVLSNKSAETLQESFHGVGIGQSVEDVKTPIEAQGGDGGGGGEGKNSGDPTSAGYRYMISEEVWNEIRAATQAGLTLPATRYADEPSAKKAHLVLQYPAEDGILFLDAVVKKVAQSLDVHVITLNAQDIAELYAEQEQEEDAPTSMMVSLGYDVYHPSKKNLQKEGEEEGEEFDEEDMEEDGDMEDRRRPGISLSKTASGSLSSSILQSLLGGRGSIGIAKVVIPNGMQSRGDSAYEVDSQSIRVVNKLLSISQGDAEAATTKESLVTSGVDASGVNEKHEPLIIQIQDYKDLLSTTAGSSFLSSLYSAVQARRRKGQKVVVIGTVSAAEENRSAAKSTSKLIPKDYDRYSTTIFVTPAMDSSSAGAIFAEDSKRRTLEINIRHLQNMLKMRLNKSTLPEHSILRHRLWPLDSSMIQTSGLDAEYWPLQLVHRIATLALGCAENPENIELRHIQQAIEVFEKSDQVKCEWMGDRQVKVKPGKTQDKPRINKARLKCNSHEEKLLNGVVDAESIRTTFADVHVPPETVEALKTLTSLSLVRPEAFTYGVLSTDKIPGLLLYGPPGTGKTLLAKAVARESGATVLEVSGSEVYDMYVGEGEKNVKAIFTLAKKLSPCVVFIDEADAIFCSRTGASSRTSHRELINQFLREWDGMNESSAFIMVATNRPFDLDDAVLRRLPRRLLVDLPTEKDRHEILKIHLKDESLDESVDLENIAHRTPFYSGSDLKNMSVAAALACVREEYDAAANYKGEEPYKYPERRILRPRHFDRAMEEISASISEDMSSLTAIRKFDEKYGDRKGRRKKAAGLGFTPPGEPEPTKDTGRVRQ